MKNLMKCKIILTDMFSRQFAQDCVDENDSVGDNQLELFLKKKHLSNNIYDDKFDLNLLQNYILSDYEM